MTTTELYIGDLVEWNELGVVQTGKLLTIHWGPNGIGFVQKDGGEYTGLPLAMLRPKAA
jgi:hypothetical protein